MSHVIHSFGRAVLESRTVTAAEEVVRPANGQTGIDPAYRARAEEAAEKFEGFFIGQLLRQMRSGTRALAGEDSVFGSRTNEEMLDLADTLLGDALARQRAFGIADVILRQLLPVSPAPENSAALKEPAPSVASDK